MSASPADVLGALPPWAAVSERRVAHIARVVAVLDGWAGERGVPAAEASRWLRAALLHDALRDADTATLAADAPPDWPRKLWHGPAASAAAARAGESDAGVLDAIRYHSVGYAGWDDVGRFLFLADYLEPGRKHDRALLDDLAARAAREPEAALREVAAHRIRWLAQAQHPIQRETCEFWNGLVAAGQSR